MEHAAEIAQAIAILRGEENLALPEDILLLLEARWITAPSEDGNPT